MSMGNSSDPSGNGTRDLSVSSAVPQPPVSPRATNALLQYLNFLIIYLPFHI